MKQTFAEFKDRFYGKVKDLPIFDAGEINLLKVVLDGLKVDYASKGNIRVFIFYPSFLRKTFFFFFNLKQLFSNKKKFFDATVLESLGKKSKRKFLIIDPAGRVVNVDSKTSSFYFTNPIHSLKRENVAVFVEGKKTASPDKDFLVEEYNLRLAMECGMDKKENRQLLSSLRNCYQTICDAAVFSDEEKLNIQIAFQQFFIQVVFWRKILSVMKPEKVFLWPHYHREGCIYAFKEKNIGVIELQHGLIAEEDIFYVFPKQVGEIEKRALLADEIWVYGNFWKDQLLKGAGYDASQIKICGYYPVVVIPSEEKKASLRNIFPGKKIFLVTTQTFMDEYFCIYIKFLSENIASRNLPYAVFVKLHPAESIEKYSSVSQLPNVKIINENLDALFPVVDIHISVYSTTLFDALRFGIPNFSIYFQPFSDYIELFRKEGIARVIQPNENPVDFQIENFQTKPKEYYFEDYHADFFQNLVSN